MKVIYKTLTVLSFCLQGREHDDYNCFFFFFLSAWQFFFCFTLKPAFSFIEICSSVRPNKLGESPGILGNPAGHIAAGGQASTRSGAESRKRKERGREGCFTDVFYCRGESCVHLKTSLCGLDCKTPSSSIRAVCHTRPEQVVCFLGFQEKKWAQKAARLYLSQLQKPIFSKSTTCVLG